MALMAASKVAPISANRRSVFRSMPSWRCVAAGPPPCPPPQGEGKVASRSTASYLLSLSGILQQKRPTALLTGVFVTAYSHAVLDPCWLGDKSPPESSLHYKGHCPEGQEGLWNSWQVAAIVCRDSHWSPGS